MKVPFLIVADALMLSSPLRMMLSPSAEMANCESAPLSSAAKVSLTCSALTFSTFIGSPLRTHSTLDATCALSDGTPASFMTRPRSIGVLVNSSALLKP